MKQFSKNFLSLQLQLKTIMEDAGGDELMGFLDQLSCLNRSEQQVALKLFKRTLEKFTRGTLRLETLGDLALKEFEESLFNDLVEDVEQAQRAKYSINRGTIKDSALKGSRLEPLRAEPLRAMATPVVSENGKGEEGTRTIDLASERARRKGVGSSSPVSVA